GAALIVPLEVDGRVHGGLSLSFGEVRDFDQVERDFVMALARQCAQSLERARLYEAAQAARRAAEEARAQLDAVLRSLPVAVVVSPPDGRGVKTNDQVRAVLGVRPDPDPEYRPGIMKRLDGTPYTVSDLPLARAQRGEIIDGEELWLDRSDGTRIRLRA